jgi:hypothetical protein
VGKTHEKHRFPCVFFSRAPARRANCARRGATARTVQPGCARGCLAARIGGPLVGDGPGPHDDGRRAGSGGSPERRSRPRGCAMERPGRGRNRRRRVTNVHYHSGLRPIRKGGARPRSVSRRGEQRGAVASRDCRKAALPGGEAPPQRWPRDARGGAAGARSEEGCGS